jgi:hypothetical protein
MPSFGAQQLLKRCAPRDTTVTPAAASPLTASQDQGALEMRESEDATGLPAAVTFEIAKLSLRPGDMLLVKLPGRCPADMVRRAYDAFNGALPAGVRALVIDDSIAVSIITREKASQIPAAETGAVGAPSSPAAPPLSASQDHPAISAPAETGAVGVMPIPSAAPPITT